MNTTNQTSSETLVFAYRRRPAFLVALIFLSLLIPACRDSKVDAYRVPKGKDVNLPAAATAPDPASAQASDPVAAPATS